MNEDDVAESNVTTESETLENIPNEAHSHDIELEALKEAARVLRDDPDVSALLKVVRSTPDIFAEVQPILARRDELSEAALPGELHRTFAPLFAGIALSKRAKDILNIAIDRNTQRETEWMFEQIRSGCTYVPEIVVGSGVHAAIYNAERIMLDPDNPSVTVDSSTKIGGQFAQPETPVWHLNTRTRPETPDAAHVPGAEGSLNTLGSSGVLQQSDLSGDAYGSQDTLSLPTRVNHLLFSKVLHSTEVVAVKENNSAQSGDSTRTPLYSVTLRYKQSGEELVVQTDRLILASGLGEPVTGFEGGDQKTLALIDQESKVHESGNDARIMTFEQFAQRVGEESNPFPLRGMERVAIIGPGDGGAVAAEFLLGYGPGLRKSVTQLDRVEKVVWLGQKSASRDAYLHAARQRYRDLGLEFPVDQESGYVHRIDPVPARAVKLEKLESGNIRIHYGIKNADGSTTITGTTDVDHIILATGFKDTTDEICSDVLCDEAEKTEFLYDSAGAPIARKYKGTQIYKIGPAAKLPVSTKDAKASPAMQRGKEIKGTVAVWASAEETEESARQMPEVTYPEQPVNFVTNEPVFTEIPLPPTGDLVVAVDSSPVEVVVDSKLAERILHPGTVTEDVLRFVVESKLGDMRFPDTINELIIYVERSGISADGRLFLQVRTEQNLESNDAYREVITNLSNDDIAQAVFSRLTERSHGRGLVIHIPIYEGKVEVSELYTKTPRRTLKTVQSSRPEDLQPVG